MDNLFTRCMFLQGLGCHGFQTSTASPRPLPPLQHVLRQLVKALTVSAMDSATYHEYRKHTRDLAKASAPVQGVCAGLGPSGRMSSECCSGILSHSGTCGDCYAMAVVNWDGELEYGSQLCICKAALQWIDSSSQEQAGSRWQQQLTTAVVAPGTTYVPLNSAAPSVCLAGINWCRLLTRSRTCMMIRRIWKCG